MSGYDLYLSSGILLTTVNVKTIDDRAHTSVVLIGQGIPNYGAYVAQDLVWMLEHFAKATSPSNPLIGQQWYDTVEGKMKVYTADGWKALSFEV
jgi:hypothetical protein